MPQDNTDILRAINDLQNSIKDLNYQVSSQNHKIQELDQKFTFSKTFSQLKDVDSVPTPLSPPPPPPRVVAEDRREVSDLLSQIGKIDSFSMASKGGTDSLIKQGRSDDRSLDKTGNVGNSTNLSSQTEGRNEESGSLEERIGGRWFAKIGMAVVILGLSFFLKYAFDNDWIGPGGRVLIGLFVGITLLFLGEKYIRRFFLYGQILSGGGLAALYLSVYVALSFYGLIDPMVGFAFMTMVTGVAIALSLRYNASSLIIVALLGGFATPFLVSTGENNQVGLFSYIILLDLAVLFVSIFKNWRWLQICGFLGTMIIFQGWFEKFYSVDQLFSTLFFLTVFFVIYSLSALFYNLIRKTGSSGYEQLLAMFSGLVYFGACYGILNSDFHDLLGVLAVVLAVYYFLWAFLAKELTPTDDNLYNFLAFLCIGFITIAIPIQFKEFTITISWLVEASLLMFLGAKFFNTKGDVLKVFGFFVYFLAVGRILIDASQHDTTDLMFINKYFFSSLAAIISAYFAAGCFKNFVGWEDASRYSTVLGYKKTVHFFMVVASLLTVFAVSREIDAWHKNLIYKEYDVVRQANEGVKADFVYNYQGSLVEPNHERIGLLEERSGVLMSIFVLVYSFFIIGWGLLKDYRSLVFTGIIINAFVLLKLFFVDLWAVKSAYRTMLSLTGVVGSYFNVLLFSGKTVRIISFREAKKYMLLFAVVANVLTVFFISREISVYYEKLIAVTEQEGQKACQAENNSDSLFGSFNSNNEISNSEACNLYQQKIKKLNNQASVAISIFWLFYAIVLVALGFIKRLKGVRLGGMALLLIAIAKLFFYDLWSLGQLYRIIASISLGVVLLGISFAYQKYRDVFREIIS